MWTQTGTTIRRHAGDGALELAGGIVVMATPLLLWAAFLLAV